MKKVTLFLGSALFVAGMMFSCGNNNAEAVEEDTTAATEEVQAEEALLSFHILFHYYLF